MAPRRMHLALLAFAAWTPACGPASPPPAKQPDVTIELPAVSSSEDNELQAAGDGEPQEATRERAASRDTTDGVDRNHDGTLRAPINVAHPPHAATTSPTGLASLKLQQGTGSRSPGPTDRVKVHYTGWMQDGVMFDSSVTRGKPATFRVNALIKGWTEGLQLMTVGEKRRFWIPAALAYGDQPRREGAPFGQLTFDVELLEIIQTPVVQVPSDVSGPPPTAKTTPSGLAYRVLKAGHGQQHPLSTSRVKVHYSGWTTNGNLFDSSVQRGHPATFTLAQVIKGWVEGVQLMVEGETTRFWIPASLAYGVNPTRAGAPAGMLVFDVELIEILQP